MNEKMVPIPEDCWEEIISLMRERQAMGLARYQVPLMEGTCANPSKEALEEVLDLVVYLFASCLRQEKQVSLLRKIHRLGQHVLHPDTLQEIEEFLR